MDNKIIKIRELEKKLTKFQEIPRGNAETAYVFFQSKDNSKYAITTEKKKIMSSQLKNGKYDRIMEIQRGWFEKKIHKEIPCQEKGHHFTLELTVEYYISDPEYIYLNRNYSMSAELDRLLSCIEGELLNQYSYTNQADLTKNIRPLIDKKLRGLPYLEYSFDYKIGLDEGSKDLLNNQMQHEIKIDKINKESYEELLKSKDKDELNRTKMDSLGNLIKTYGANAGDMISHVNGEISGKDLSTILKADKNEQIERNFGFLMKLYKEGLIDETKMSGVLNTILPEIGQAVSPEQIETKKNNMDEGDEYIEHKPFQWKNS